MPADYSEGGSIWAVVALVAIVALFLSMRQAMNMGNKVELSWKVTRHVSGRLVISKIENKATRKGRKVPLPLTP
jgi:hypothetical protein